MEKKSVSATILVIYLTLIFSVVGVCFSSFVFPYTKIEVETVALTASVGIEIFEDKDLTKKAEKLKLSNMDLGLKPATGELDAESGIPSTITNEGSSEGYYAEVYLKATGNCKVVIKNIKIETERNQIEAEEERKSVFVSIMDVKNTTKSLEEDEVELVVFENLTEPKKLVFLIWLDSLAGEELEGAKISFDIDFQAV